MKTTLLVSKSQSVLEHALSKIDFPTSTDIYMLPSNLNLSIKLEQTGGYNNKTLISNTDMTVGSNEDINKAEVYHQQFQLPPALSKFGRTQGLAHATPEMHSMKSSYDLIKETILLADKRKMLAEKHSDEVFPLLITGTGLIACHFWQVLTPLAQHEDHDHTDLARNIKK